MAQKKKHTAKESARTKSGGVGQGRPPAQNAPQRPMVTTTFRIYRDQLVALQQSALQRKAEGAPGRADASALLREILDNGI
jgi:hypothetical protein